MANRLAQDQFNSDLQIALFVEKQICKHHRCAFPVNVLLDKTLSNTTPLQPKPLEYKVLTIDFGIVTRSGQIIDTAISFVKPPYDKDLLDYRKRFLLVENVLAKLCKAQGWLSVEQISQTVDKIFSKAPWVIVDECGAHTIELNKLHGQIIPMTKKVLVQLKPDQRSKIVKRFTIEPHCVIGKNYKLTSLPSTIVADKDWHIDGLDERLGNLKGKPERKYYGLATDKIGFYEEQTYEIRYGKLVKLT